MARLHQHKARFDCGIVEACRRNTGSELGVGVVAICDARIELFEEAIEIEAAAQVIAGLAQ